MRLTNLLLLAGAALAANSWMNKTEKGKQFKRDLTDNANKLSGKVKDAVSRYGKGNSSSDDLFADTNPTGGNNYGGSGSPM
ncbi:MAG: hypothetical protein EOP49_05660 [Sphingobacteriales bacterium]|nr:MAG: hypothetical protein EOP49_05660 [Sphingobacteriales bacterium]